VKRPQPAVSQRVRTPAPVLRTRLPSGRGATEQPNATPVEDAPLTLRFWVLVVATGVATGLLGDALMFVLHVVERLAFGHVGSGFTAAVRAVPGSRRILALATVGAVGGVGWFWIRRLMPADRTHLDDEVWTGTGVLSFRRSLATSVLSEIAVGGGASLGREAAPKLMGGASASLLARWGSLTPAQRRLLVACGGGAGLAAVYNVPLGGALITAELLYGSLALPVILPALMCSWVATAVAWLTLGNDATYPDIPAFHLQGSHVVFAVVAGPIIGLASVAWIRLLGWVSHRQARGRLVLVGPIVAFALLGVVALWRPQLMGNGQDLAHGAFLATGGGALGLFLVLAGLKPLVTAACLGSGASGGLFTPTLAIGALLGAAGGEVLTHIWPGAPVGSYALIGAAAMIGAAMQTPLSALAIVVELTRTADTLIVPLIAATALSTIVSRYLDGYSIYSARLPPQVKSHLDSDATDRA
jgi:CIC family chloride channel protein